MSEKQRRLRLVITGRVQGVWYRGSMQTMAEQLGVAGWVRNAPDGSVEAVVEGPPAALDALVEWCRKGPQGARVLDVVATAEPVEGLQGFRIAR